jgi:hypothetical protein
MTSRLLARLLLAALLSAAWHTAEADPAVRPLIRVALAPVWTDKLSGVAWRAMTKECDDIWAREGVSLDWTGWSAGADVAFPLVFDHRQVRQHDRRRASAFGVTLFAGRSQRILVSIARAREVVGQRHGLADTNDAMRLDIALGIMLGRVVAHEIGHALLLTTAHAAEGLMRPRIDADDLRPPLDGQFALVEPDRQRLSVRFSNAAPRETVLATFTWTDGPPAPSPLRAPR